MIQGYRLIKDPTATAISESAKYIVKNIEPITNETVKYGGIAINETIKYSGIAIKETVNITG